jgi:hypothetical protein
LVASYQAHLASLLLLLLAFVIICLIVSGVNGLMSALPGMAIGGAVMGFVWLSGSVPGWLFRRRQR